MVDRTSVIKISAMIVILAASAIVFPVSFDAGLAVVRLDLNVIQHSNFRDFFYKIQQPFAGEYIIREDALMMIRWLRTYNVPDFRLSPRIKAMELVMQRVIEGGYPVRLSDSSRYLLMYSNEPMPSGATILTEAEGVILAYCP